eukprot:CAMPEP_0182438314 /NCGR_PEP_ID=MMETSP1167-20130531/85673_1 /TAXON_ID=2988 /ORGANISM="Mallomonas Sp, Strain CCMP3275" /LENGTH=584 /DNA_ID=CAMNT_0024631609 /DNA_START=3775 /DNA_END=5529 /DNA_ORIENTATION=-
MTAMSLSLFPEDTLPVSASASSPVRERESIPQSMGVKDMLPRSVQTVERLRSKIVRIRRIKKDFEFQVQSVQLQMREQTESAQSKITVITQRLATACAQIELLKSTVDRDRLRRDTDVKEVIAYRDSVINEHIRTAKEFEDRVTSLQKTVQQERNLTKATEKECAALRHHVQDLQQECGDYKKQIEELHSAEQTMKSLSSKLQSLSTSYDSTTRDLHTYEQRIKELEAERVTTLTTVDSLTQQLKSSVETINKLELKITKLENTQIPPDLLHSLRDTESIIRRSNSNHGIDLEKLYSTADKFSPVRTDSYTGSTGSGSHMRYTDESGGGNNKRNSHDRQNYHTPSPIHSTSSYHSSSHRRQSPGEEEGVLNSTRPVGNTVHGSEVYFPSRKGLLSSSVKDRCDDISPGSYQEGRHSRHISPDISAIRATGSPHYTSPPSLQYTPYRPVSLSAGLLSTAIKPPPPPPPPPVYTPSSSSSYKHSPAQYTSQKGVHFSEPNLPRIDAHTSVYGNRFSASNIPSNIDTISHFSSSNNSDNVKAYSNDHTDSERTTDANSRMSRIGSDMKDLTTHLDAFEARAKLRSKP